MSRAERKAKARERDERDEREGEEPVVEALAAEEPEPEAEVAPQEAEERSAADDSAEVSAELAPAAEQQDESTLSIDNTVVEKIVAIVCRSIDGILSMKGNLISSIQEGFGGTDLTKGVSVEMVGEDACVVSVSIIMEYGKSAPLIFQELHDRITEKVTDMTGLKVNSVNVRITNVMTREEIEGGRRREKAERAGEEEHA
jgi:uncharacterized alkaline shock family protein YloU